MVYRALISFLLCILLTAPARAEGDRFAAFAGQYQMGMEIELQPVLLQKLVPHFDWKKVQSDLESGRKILNPRLQRTFESGTGPLKDRRPKLLASIAIELARDSEGTAPLYPPLRADLAPEIAEVFEGLNWWRDNGKLEFTNVRPMADPKTYLDKLRRFAALAGIEDRLERPLDPGVEFSYHLHLSRKDRRDIGKTLAAYNRLVLARLLDANAANELFDNSRTSQFAENLYARGIVRQVDARHFETRRRTGSAEAELAELMHWFSLPEETAVTELALKTQKLLTPALLDRLIELAPNKVVKTILALNATLPPDQRTPPLDGEALLRRLNAPPCTHWLARLLGHE